MKRKRDKSVIRVAQQVKELWRLSITRRVRNVSFARNLVTYSVIAESERSQQSPGERTSRKQQQKANSADVKATDSNEAGLMLSHLLTAREQLAGRWIIDSGATSHICNDRDLFVQLHPLKSPLDVVLGDGHKLTATAKGTVKLTMK